MLEATTFINQTLGLITSKSSLLSGSSSDHSSSFEFQKIVDESLKKLKSKRTDVLGVVFPVLDAQHWKNLIDKKFKLTLLEEVAAVIDTSTYRWCVFSRINIMKTIKGIYNLRNKAFIYTFVLASSNCFCG
ncbi:uncharacterized protein LOC113272673 [Papaver somniferum]|uniref:uncharacterized protein LOC113272673 n=1 Tax=Papaver somniferum TaxID=3469 RepID=UPI000E704581|nr:uncharacterized protein LOC113272673 [Papaver somniferum]